LRSSFLEERPNEMVKKIENVLSQMSIVGGIQ
jgi:hypothetical protein